MNEISLRHCLQLIEEKLEWGSSTDWLNQDFQLLSDRIFEETKVRLSITTLKRVWGKVNYDSAPSISTLNALASFLGHENWSAFRQQVQAPPIVKQQNQSVKKPLLVALSSILILSIVGLLAFSGGKTLTPFTEEELSRVSFSSAPVTLGLPNSVVFKYDFAGLGAESTAIRQSWNEQLTFSVDQNRQEATGIYYYPGYFRAKLVANGQILKEHDIHIRTKGWMATIGTGETPRYLYQEEITKNGVLQLAETTYQEVHDMDLPEAPLLTYHHFQDFGQVRGDDFSFETRFRNTYRKSNGICQHTRILIHGKNGVIIAPFSIPGCISDLEIFAMGNVINGKTNDLSAFGTDITQWQKLKLIVKDETAQLFLNEQLIKEFNIPAYMGELVGFKYRFMGAGEIDYAILTGPEGIALEEHFGGDALNLRSMKSED